MVSGTQFAIVNSLDTFGFHGIGGMWIVIVTGIWATKTIKPDRADGLLYGNPLQLRIQTKAAIVTIAYSFIAGTPLLEFVDAVIKNNPLVAENNLATQF